MATDEPTTLRDAFPAIGEPRSALISRAHVLVPKMHSTAP
jgi:hypothetical protein